MSTDYHTPFPDELVPVSKKEKKDYGVNVARAIYDDYHRSGNAYFYQNRVLHDEYRSYAIGKQRVDDFKAMVGVNQNEDEQAFLSYMRFNVNNYATKLVNIAISRVSSKKYDPTVRITSKNAIDRRKNLKAQLALKVIEKQWMAQRGKIMQDAEEIPDNMEELELDLAMSIKERSAVRAEKGIAHVTSRCNWDNEARRIVEDIVTVGTGVSLTSTDAAGLPTCKRINPSNCLVAYSDHQNYKDIKYAAHIEYWTVSELKKYAGKEYTKEEINKIAQDYGSSEHYENDEIFDNDVSHHRDVQKVPIMYFEWKTVNMELYKKKKNKFGNRRLYPAEEKYYNKSKRDNYKGEGEFVNDCYETVYRGYWVVNSKKVIKWGKKNHITYKDPYYLSANLGYTLFTPNKYGDTATPLVEQMIPILDDLYEINLKIRQNIANSVPKGVAIDVQALTKVNLTLGAKKMTAKDILDLYYQRGIYLFDTGEKNMAGSGVMPIQEMENGVAREVERLFNYLSQKKQDLYDIIGINQATAASSVSSDMGKGVMQMQMQASETALDHIYHAIQYITEETFKKINLLDKQSEKYKKNKMYYEEVFGVSNYRFIEDIEDFPKHSYSLKIEARPTQEDWNLLYQDATKAFDSQQIGIDDLIAIRNIHSLKEAEIYLRTKVRKNKKEMEEQQKQAMEQNAKAQQESNAQAAQAKMQELEAQGKLEMSKIDAQIRLETVKHKNAIELETLKGQMTLQANQVMSGVNTDNRIEEISAKGYEDRKNIALKEDMKLEQIEEQGKFKSKETS